MLNLFLEFLNLVVCPLVVHNHFTRFVIFVKEYLVKGLLNGSSIIPVRHGYLVNVNHINYNDEEMENQNPRNVFEKRELPNWTQ